MRGQKLKDLLPDDQTGAVMQTGRHGTDTAVLDWVEEVGDAGGGECDGHVVGVDY